MEWLTKFDRNFSSLLRLQELFKVNQLFPATNHFTESLRQLGKVMEQVKWSTPVLGNPFSQLGLSLFPSRYKLDVGMIDAQFRQLAQMQKIALAGFDRSFLDTLKMFPVERINEALFSVRIFANELQLPAQLLRQAIRSVEDYQAFASRQLRRAVATKDAELGKRYLAIADAAGGHLEYIQGLAAEVWQTWEDSGEESGEEASADNDLPCNFFLTLNKHLAWAYRMDRIVDPEKAVAESLPARIQEAGVRLGLLVIQLNKITEGMMGKDLFKPTNQNMEGMLRLVTAVVENESDFACLMDILYFLIYEGTAEAKRLLEFTSNADLTPLWEVKRLRRMFRHDLAHGKDAEVERKFIEGGTILMSLVGQRWPQKPIHWKMAQLNIYRRLGDMLEGLLQNILESTAAQ